MKKLSLLILIFLIFSISNNVYSSLADSNNATLFPNGGFETGSLSDWNMFQPFPADANTVPGCSGGNALLLDYNKVDTNWASDGFFGYKIKNDVTGSSQSCLRIQNTSLNSFTGKYIFRVDVNAFFTNGTGNPDQIKTIFDNNASQNCTFNLSNAGFHDVNCTTPSNLISSTYSVNWVFNCSTGGTCSGDSFSFDKFRYELVPTLSMNVTEESDPFSVDENFLLSNRVTLDSNGGIVKSADCNVIWAGTNFDMPINNDTNNYEFTVIQTSPATISYNVACASSSFDPDQNVTGNVTFIKPLTGGTITVTDIENVTHIINISTVDFLPTEELDQIIYSIKNNFNANLTIPQNIFNSLVDGRQYFIYTANQNQYNSGIWVFNDTLTFGSSNSTSIQRIWDENRIRFKYSFTDTIATNETKFYLLKYQNPYKSYLSIKGNSDWSIQLLPQVLDTNTIPIDNYSISSFSNLRNIYVIPVPDISGDENQAFELQFIAWSDVNNIILRAGTTLIEVDNVTDNISLTTQPHTYSVSINSGNFNDQILLKTNSTDVNSTNVYIYGYVIVPRGYFTHRLELEKANGDALDSVIINASSEQYLQEGDSFRINSEAYDRNGDVFKLEIKAYLDANVEQNVVYKIIEDVNSDVENFLTFNELLQGIIDLSGNATSFPLSSLRTVIVKATLFDLNNQSVSEQSKTVKFIQFPYFLNDLKINFIPSEKRVGKHPQGILEFYIRDSNLLEGFDIRIFDVNTSINSPDYHKRIYKEHDFDCITLTDCSLNILIDDFIFEDANYINIQITAMISTEYFSLTNPFVYTLRTILVSPIEFDTAKILEVTERTDHTYRPDEEIPLVLVLRSDEADNLYNKIAVNLTISNCSAGSGGTCTTQTRQFKPTGFIYDDKYSYNYYFFRHFWILDNGQPLPDGNFVRFSANVTDQSGASSSFLISSNFGQPLLTSKCQTNSSNFFTTLLTSLLEFGFGCTTPQVATVTTNVNSSQEKRLDIDSNRAVTPPTQQLFGCVAPDINNVINEPLKQDILCFMIYKVGESPIDTLRLRISNNNTDFSKDGSTKQFVEFKVPYEIISYNDIGLLRRQLEASQDTSINTIGEFVFLALTKMAGPIPLFVYGLSSIQDITDYTGPLNVDSNNFNVDFNFNDPLDPTKVGGLVFYKIKGLPVVNAQDFKFNSRITEIFDKIPRSNFLDYLAQNDINFSTNVPAELQLIVSDFEVPIKITDASGHLLIDESPSDNQINNQNINDKNNFSKFVTIPNQLIFNIQNTMFFANFSAQDSLSIILTILTTIQRSFNNALNEFASDLFSDPVSAFVGFLAKNLLLIIILLALIYIATVYSRNLYSGG